MHLLLVLFLGQAQPLTFGEITLSKPLAGLDNLHNIDPLLECHDWERDNGQDPGDGTIHLVGTVGGWISVIVLWKRLKEGGEGEEEEEGEEGQEGQEGEEGVEEEEEEKKRKDSQDSPSHFHRTGRPGTAEQSRRFLRNGRGTRLKGRRLGRQERGRDEGGGESEKVEGDEEELIQSTANEEDVLCKRVSKGDEVGCCVTWPNSPCSSSKDA